MDSNPITRAVIVTGAATVLAASPAVAGAADTEEVAGAPVGEGTGVSAVATPSPAASSDQVAPETAAVAVDWALSQLGSTAYDGLCLAFVHDAYLTGAGYEIGYYESAIAYWNAHPDQQVIGDTAPPEGALVFWNATDTNEWGHVAIAEGGGDMVVSSYEGTTYGVHEFSIADRNAAGYPYLGWILP